MDKIELTREDIEALLEWRDEHKSLVRSLPAPLKAVEISFKHNSYRIKGIRKGDQLTLYVSNDGENLGRAEMQIGENGQLIRRKTTLKIDEEDFQSTLTVYCSLMALMVYWSGEQKQVELPKEKKPHAGNKSAPTKRKQKVTYILQRRNGELYAAPKGSHASPKGIFSVRGHYRHYKSGKVVWISEYKKGTGKTKPKTYKMGGKKNERKSKHGT